MKRLAIITSHPIQYNAPFFKLLAAEYGILLKVFYTLGQDASDITDKGFGKKIKWDIPLLEGYDYEFVQNTSPNPGTSYFKGIINPTLIDTVQNFRPSHILVYGWNFYSHLKILRYFKNKTVLLFRGDSTLLDEVSGLKLILRRLWLKWVYKHVDVVLFVGTNNKKYFLAYGVSEEKLVFAPHAVDNDRFCNPEHEAKAVKLKATLGLAPEKKVFLFTGKFERKKNPQLLIEAFKHIYAPDAVLVMVGNGALEAELKELAGGAPNIKFLPFQNQSVMPAVYRIGDVLVLPSAGPGETWGLCMNEAMASRLAIVSSDKVGGAVDLIEEGKNGFVFRSGNIPELTDILQTMAFMPKQELALMGTRSAMKVKDFSYYKTCLAILDIIN